LEIIFNKINQKDSAYFYYLKLIKQFLILNDSLKLGKVLPNLSIIESDFDVFLISSLSNGFPQEDISKKLKEKGIQPSSTIAIVKRLKILK